MKKTFLLGSILMTAIAFTACDNDDIPQFQYDENGTCYMPNVKSIPHTEFLKYAENSGWEHVSTHEIYPNGEVEKKDYYDGLIGGGPSTYYFEKDTYTNYFFGSYPIDAAYINNSYTYQKEGNLIGQTNRFTDSFFTQFQVLSINENELKMVEYLGWGGGESRNIYGLTTYRKMSKEDLAAMQEEHVNINDIEFPAQFHFKSHGINHDYFQKQIIGHGWQWNYTYEISEDSTYKQKNYFANQDMATHYYFDKDTLIRFYQAADGSFTSSKEPYTLTLTSESYLKELVNETTGDTIYPYRILIPELNIRETLTTRNGKPVYGISSYIRMTDKKLQEFLEKYSGN